MKHLILAASFALIAVPAFAGDVHDSTAPKVKAFTDTQISGDMRSYDADSNRAKRDANLRRAAEGRSENARAAMRGLPHYF